MVKKKSYTKDMKDANQVILGGALTLHNMQLLQPGATCPGSGNLLNAGLGTGQVMVQGILTDVAFKSIDNIYKSGKKKRKK